MPVGPIRILSFSLRKRYDAKHRPPSIKPPLVGKVALLVDVAEIRSRVVVHLDSPEIVACLTISSLCLLLRPKLVLDEDPLLDVKPVGKAGESAYLTSRRLCERNVLGDQHLMRHLVILARFTVAVVDMYRIRRAGRAEPHVGAERAEHALLAEECRPERVEGRAAQALSRHVLGVTLVLSLKRFNFYDVYCMKTRKCRSECLSKTKNECMYPTCRWVRPQTKKDYCRIAPSHTLSDSCEVVLRKPVDSVNTYPSYLLLGDSGEMTTFGLPISVLADFFQYTNFNYVADILPNPHGVQLLYLKEGLTSYATLRKSSPPNLYEYIVGSKFINPVLPRFPCFLYTYGFYYSKSVSPPKFFSKKRDLQSSLVLHGIDEQACHEPISYLLQQDLDQSETLSSRHEPYRIQILFMIYHALAALTFTHHQLNMENIRVWRPHPKKTIEYVYHLGKKTCTFECPYVVKITNYEKAYFSNQEASSEEVYREFPCINHSKYDPRKDVSLAREFGMTVPLYATVKQVYKMLREQLPSSTGNLGRMEVFGSKPMKYTHF